MITKFLLTKKFRDNVEKEAQRAWRVSSRCPWTWKALQPILCDICGEKLPPEAMYYFVIIHNYDFATEQSFIDWCARLSGSGGELGHFDFYKTFFVHGPHKPCKELLPLRY